MPILGTPLQIRADILDRRQAMENHDQTLERLAERGGLSLCEAAAIFERRPWRKMTADEAMEALKKARIPAAPKGGTECAEGAV